MRTAQTILDAVPPTAEPDPAGAALTARVSAATERGRDLRDRAAVSALPLPERGKVLGVVADSQDFFTRMVERSWVPDYLADRNLVRGIATHQLGYAPDSWTALTDHLRSLGYSDETIEAAGVATRARTGNLVDRFRDRLTIPLRDPAGDVVGFTARRAPDADGTRVPKYLNTPTTTLFHKHEILYGLTENASRIRAGATPVVCEGALDAIAIDLNARDQQRDWAGVASIGTAFTDDHAHRLLDAMPGGPISLAFDGDSAGRSATEATWRKLTDHAPADVRIVAMPDGSDPSALMAVDPWALARAIIDAQPAATVIAARQIGDARLDYHAGRRLTAFRSLCRLVDRVPADQRPTFLLGLAERLRIEPADAATLTAEQNPGLTMDAIADRAHRLEDAMTSNQGTRAMAGSDGPRPIDDDHLRHAIATR